VPEADLHSAFRLKWNTKGRESHLTNLQCTVSKRNVPTSSSSAGIDVFGCILLPTGEVAGVRSFGVPTTCCSEG